MILQCSFEEITAATAAAGRVLVGTGSGSVAAPPQVAAEIEALMPRLTGDLSIDTLSELRAVERALQYVLECARDRTDAFIIDQHPAAEAAVASYFEFAHILTLTDRTRRLGAQMSALIELMSGAPVTDASAAHYQFPD
jgi:hypothetical protein